ncbi:ABC transporter permease [Zooshikella ganghwensis]|uniref:ABC transporter permease n=1 Tax=Zooshikella ganghwensis TaxID=202772 RepID=UPI002D80F4FB|nr:iron ABC transporter permease [Zooshikella ganghwensis]
MIKHPPLLRRLSFTTAGIVLMPLLVLILSWHDFQTDIWLHLIETQLGRLLANTLVLLVGVGFGVMIIGVSLAWLTTMCEFPGRKFFDWALMLPFAIPAYVLAFVYLGFFEFSGPLQTVIREWFGTSRFFPSIRSTGGVILVLVLVFYPYVYMLARSAFITQGRGAMDAARILGLTPLQAFWRVALPIARPAIAAGVGLALMETLADFGAVATFNYDTFTTAIYKAWYGFFNLHAAAQLATLLMLFVCMAFWLEQRGRGNAQYALRQRSKQHKPYKLNGIQRYVAFTYAASVLGLAFILPVVQLLVWVVKQGAQDIDGRFAGLVGHSLLLASAAGLAVVCVALLLSFAKRLYQDHWLKKAIMAANLGYALPGSVLAVGIMFAFSQVDNHLIVPLQEWLGVAPRQLLLGSFLALLLAYIIRFIAVAFGPIDAGLQSIRVSLHEAARSLGVSGLAVVRRVYIPMLAPGLLTAGILVFVDVMKEMPATLLMRPFGWDTLAVRIYEMTSEGEWQRAALPALTLVLAGLIPVFILMRKSRYRNESRPISKINEKNT